MKATILQENINKGMNMVNRLISSRGQLPVLSNVLIEAEKEGVVLSVTNLEIGLRADIGGKVIEEGAITIPARNLGDFIGSLAGENVNLESEGEKLKVSGGKSAATFTGIAASEFPVMPKMGEKNGGEGANLNIKKNIIDEIAREVAFAAAVDESRPVLTGVQFLQKNEQLLVTATDGFRLSRKIVETQTAEKFSHDGMILPARTIMELARIVAEGRKEEIEMVVLKQNNQVLFGYDKIVLISRVLEGNFPQVDKIIPQEFKTQLTADREELVRAVKAAAIFAKDASNIVRFKADSSSLIIEAAASQSGESQTEIEAEFEGEGGEISFNYRYVADFLNSVKSERVVFRMIDGLSPGVWKLPNDENLLHLIMPVRV